MPPAARVGDMHICPLVTPPPHVGGPILPPGGITPTVPGGVTPPIGTLPPGGTTPTEPGGVTPPIGRLPPGGGEGGGGTGTGGGGDGSVAGGGGGGGGFGGGPVNEPEVHRQLARILGTDFASRGDVISDAVSCGLGIPVASAPRLLAGRAISPSAITPSEWKGA